MDDGDVLYGEELAGYHTFVVGRTLVPGNTLTRTVDFMNAALFDSQTNKPIWSSSSKSVNLNHHLRADGEQLEDL